MAISSAPSKMSHSKAVALSIDAGEGTLGISKPKPEASSMSTPTGRAAKGPFLHGTPRTRY